MARGTRGPCHAQRTHIISRACSMQLMPHRHGPSERFQRKLRLAAEEEASGLPSGAPQRWVGGGLLGWWLVGSWLVGRRQRRRRPPAFLVGRRRGGLVGWWSVGWWLIGSWLVGGRCGLFHGGARRSVGDSYAPSDQAGCVIQQTQLPTAGYRLCRSNACNRTNHPTTEARGSGGTSHQAEHFTPTNQLPTTNQPPTNQPPTNQPPTNQPPTNQPPEGMSSWPRWASWS